MRPFANARNSIKALFAHRLRAGLAVIGVTLGVAAVIVTVAIGEGARLEVMGGIESFGADLLLVKAGKADAIRGRERQSNVTTTLTLADADAIAESCPSVEVVVPVYDQPDRIRYEELSTAATVVGTSPDYVDVRRFRVSSGRFFTPEEERASQRVAVLGAAVTSVLFADSDPIGETIRVGRVPFTVIGTLVEKGVSPDGSDEDDQIVIPLRTAMRRVYQKDYLELVYARAGSAEAMAEAESEITALLRGRHRLDRRGKPNDFEIQNLSGVLDTQASAAAAFTTMVAGVAAVALLVGGIGILSIMLLTVRERRSEIGLRLAVGARRRDVLVQFLVESLVLGLVGGLVGVGLGWAGAISVGRWTTWATEVPIEIVIGALAFSVAVGVIFGMEPARRAARLNPIDALRS